MAMKYPRRVEEQPQQASKRYFNLLAEENRGLLLDLVVFAANLLLMNLLVKFFLNLFDNASKNDPSAKFLLILACIAMWILPAAGAVLKRWHFHRRLIAEKKTLASDENQLAGCLFNPIFYFCLNLVIMSAIVAAVGQELVGPRGMDNASVFIPSIFLGLALTIVQTVLIYRYFSPPKKPPRSTFLRGPESDVCSLICCFSSWFGIYWPSQTLVVFLGLASFLADCSFCRLSRC